MSTIPTNHATQVISLALPEMAKMVAQSLRIIAGKQVGFFLMVYTQGRGSHIGNADREENARAVGELLAAWQANTPFPPTTEDWVMRVCCELPMIAQALDHDMEKMARERIGFSLVVFTPGRPSYLGTVPRQDAVRELTDLLADWANGMPDIPAHQMAMH